MLWSQPRVRFLPARVPPLLPRCVQTVGCLCSWLVRFGLAVERFAGGFQRVCPSARHAFVSRFASAQIDGVNGMACMLNPWNISVPPPLPKTLFLPGKLLEGCAVRSFKKASEVEACSGLTSADVAQNRSTSGPGGHGVGRGYTSAGAAQNRSTPFKSNSALSPLACFASRF